MLSLDEGHQMVHRLYELELLFQHTNVTSTAHPTCFQPPSMFRRPTTCSRTARIATTLSRSCPSRIFLYLACTQGSAQKALHKIF